MVQCDGHTHAVWASSNGGSGNGSCGIGNGADVSMAVRTGCALSIRVVKIEHDYAVTWSMPMSWCSRMTVYAISYLWYAALPLVVYALSYLKFKERET